MVLPNRCCVRNSMILGRGGWVLYFYLCKIDREQEQQKTTHRCRTINKNFNNKCITYFKHTSYCTHIMTPDVYTLVFFYYCSIQVGYLRKHFNLYQYSFSCVCALPLPRLIAHTFSHFTPSTFTAKGSLYPGNLLMGFQISVPRVLRSAKPGKL